MRLFVDRDGHTVICEQCQVADTFLARMKGLLGRKELAFGEGLLLRPASSIHTLFMRFPIDAVFLDRNLRVLEISADLEPWRVASRRGARAVLELPAGKCTRLGVSIGDILRTRDVPRAAGDDLDPAGSAPVST